MTVRQVTLLGLAVLSSTALAQSAAVTIVWPGSAGRGVVRLTLTASDGTTSHDYTKDVQYGEFSTAASLASSFGAYISMSPTWPVWAKGYSDGTVKMAARSAVTITNLQVCVIPSGANGCSSPPAGVIIATGAVLPYGPSLVDALYGFIIAKPDGSSGYDGVGNIIGYQDQVNQQWSAGYDRLNRLQNASQTILATNGTTFNVPNGTGVQQYLCWQYDSYGNRLSQITSTMPFSDPNSCQLQPSATHSDIITAYDNNNGNNRLTSAPGLTGITHDSAGNLTEDGSYSYLYGGDGKLCAVWQHYSGYVTGYLYDAEGTRVAKGSVSSFACPSPSNFTIASRYIPGPDGQQMTELDGAGGWIHTNVFAGGVLVATDDAAGRHYQLSDWLGNRRMQVGSTGTVEAYNQAGPYGDLATPPSSATEHYYTGQERDPESGLDYFSARMYSSKVGRFMSPDPGWMLSADLSNPQSFNMYPYVLNKPLIHTDPTGMECVWDDGSYDSEDDFDTGHIDKWGNHTDCSSKGGTWIDHGYFVQNGLGDWSSQGNSDLAGMTVASSTVNSNTSSNMACIPLSAMYGFQEGQQALVMTAYYGTRLAARLSGASIGAGIGAGAGVGAANIGFGVNGSVMLISDAKGNTVLNSSATVPFANFMKSSAKSEASGFASAGVQVLIGGKGAMSGGVQTQLDGSYGPASFSANSSSVSVGGGIGAGAHITVSPGANISSSIPICR